MNKLERNIMAGVVLVFALRSLVSRRAVALYALAASMWSLAALVWVARVRENFQTEMHSGVLATGNFVVTAVLHTHFLVQCSLLVATLAFGVILFDLIQKRAVSHRFVRMVA